MDYQLIPVAKGDVLLTLYSTVDDLVAQAPQRVPKGPGGRPAVLSNSELVTMLLYAVGVAQTKTLKAAYNLMVNSHGRDFQTLPTYQGFVDACHRALPLLGWVLERLMVPVSTDRLRLVDATKLPVCKDVRATTHKVMTGHAAWGKTSQGWFFGLKLHLAVTDQGALRVALVTPGNVSDRTPLNRLLHAFRGVALGDAGYLVKRTDHRTFWQQGIWLLTGVRKNMGKLMTSWQHRLLKIRQRVESVFDELKEHYHLISSFPRSVSGYLLHLVLVLLTYQFHMVYGVI